MRGTRVTEVVPAGEEFRFVCADGMTGAASKILLATGLVDELPDVERIEPLYGLSVHHCLYCDVSNTRVSRSPPVVRVIKVPNSAS